MCHYLLTNSEIAISRKFINVSLLILILNKDYAKITNYKNTNSY